jgi:hypothetical protein
MYVNIIQHGTDGFGHQLLGLFSLLLLHGVKSGHLNGNYYFDPYIFMDKEFKFAHISKKELELCKNYMIEVVTNFKNDYNLMPKKYDNILYFNGLHLIKNENLNDKTVFKADNAYSKNIGLNEIENAKRINNINRIKKYFVNSYIKNVFNSEKNIVVHIRRGDAISRFKNVDEDTNNILKIIQKLKLKYPSYKIYIHSDGDDPKIDDTIFCNKNTNILETLSNFVHADILVSSNSCLSRVASFLGNKILNIVPDETKNKLLPDNVFTFSEFLSL